MTAQAEAAPRRTIRGRLIEALPFWLSLTVVPLVALAALEGGWAILLPPLWGWVVISILDQIAGLDLANADPDTPEERLFWYRAIVMIWPAIEAVLIFWVIWQLTRGGSAALSGLEKLGVAWGLGVATGTVGINYAHELMHQKNRLERWLGDVLMTLVLYGHFRSEHLLVHHPWVGTPRDPVTARYNESFLRFFPRVLIGCLISSFRAERAMLARRGLPWWHRRNPFWRYLALQALWLALAWWIGGWAGVGLFAAQAFFAVWQLELVNYIEHYGLVRRHLGDGRYEPVRPHHSWNAAHKVSNWLLINLQRHSDHHYKPDRRFPLLQNHGPEAAPQLPAGYPVMTALAMVPPLWRRVMNPRVRAWRRRYYPDIEDWSDYARMATPMPRGAS